MVSMVKLELDQPAVMRLGRTKGLPMREVDLGYLIHCLLREVFGDKAPQPFDVRDQSGRTLEVLAYTTTAAEELRRHADTFAHPEQHAALNWKAFHQKPMPSEWPESLELGFETRVCPVVRAASDTEHYSQGSEVDAFLTRLAETEEDEEALGREEVYREWLEDQLLRRGGVELLNSRMQSFSLRKLTRRTHGPGRKARVFTRPDTRMTGRFRIEEPEKFPNLLKTGVGRHRAFGFGMVLLHRST